MRYSLYTATAWDFALSVLAVSALILTILMARLAFEAWLDSGRLEESSLFRMITRWYLWWVRFFDARDGGGRLDEIHRR